MCTKSEERQRKTSLTESNCVLVLCLCCVPCVALFLRCHRCRYGIVCASVTLVALCYAALGPTLETRLLHMGVPQDTLSSTTGLYFLADSFLYMALAAPLGLMMDKGCCMTKTLRIDLLDEDLYSHPPHLYDDFSDDDRSDFVYVKRCCCASKPHSNVLPMVFVGMGMSCGVRSY